MPTSEALREVERRKSWRVCKASVASWGSRPFRHRSNSARTYALDSNAGQVILLGYADRFDQRLGEEVQVCIIDLIDSRRLGGRVRTFTSKPELQQHIKTKKHYFPKDLAKEEADGLLRVLLRTI